MPLRDRQGVFVGIVKVDIDLALDTVGALDGINAAARAADARGDLDVAPLASESVVPHLTTVATFNDLVQLHDAASRSAFRREISDHFPVLFTIGF